jgi:Lon protease-like protein
MKQIALWSLSLFLGKWNVSSAFLAVLSAPSSRPRGARLSLSPNADSNDDDFMKALKSRMEQVSDRATKIPIVVIDSILPRQVLKIEADDPAFTELVRTCLHEENPYFGMVGVAQLAKTGQMLPLQNGAEVEIVGKPTLGDTGLRVELRGGRRFRIEGELSTSGKGWTEARVRYLDAADEERDEEKGDDPLSLARAFSRARELICPSINMPDGASLVQRWIALAKENERNPGQIDKLLSDLGETPSPDEPTELAMWIGALINPLPGMGVAMEIRPALLMARTAEERVLVALAGISASIKHMDGSQRLF